VLATLSLNKRWVDIFILYIFKLSFFPPIYFGFLKVGRKRRDKFHVGVGSYTMKENFLRDVYTLISTFFLLKSDKLFLIAPETINNGTINLESTQPRSIHFFMIMIFFSLWKWILRKFYFFFSLFLHQLHSKLDNIKCWILNIFLNDFLWIEVQELKVIQKWDTALHWLI